jgi:hypothetical protein
MRRPSGDTTGDDHSPSTEFSFRIAPVFTSMA